MITGPILLEELWEQKVEVVLAIITDSELNGMIGSQIGLVRVIRMKQINYSQTRVSETCQYNQIMINHLQSII